MKVDQEEMYYAVMDGTIDALISAFQNISSDKILKAVEKGVQKAIFEIAREGLESCDEGFYNSIRNGVRDELHEIDIKINN